MEIQATGAVIGQPAYGHVGYVAAARQNAMADALASPGTWLILGAALVAVQLDFVRRKRPNSRWPVRFLWICLAVVMSGLVADVLVYREQARKNLADLDSVMTPRTP